MAQNGYPTVLTAETTISQSTQRPSQLALMNPSGEALKIHEIRFTLKDTTARAFSITGGTIGCKLDLGSVALTKGFIPVWNFGRVLSYDQDLNNQFTWRLAHPIYVPAGGVLLPNFQSFGQVYTPITARITYFGVSVTEQLPKRVFLPWVSAYVGKAFPYDTAGTDASNETDLLNPFDQDLVISRLVGRFNIFNADSTVNLSRVGGQLLSVRAALSNGDPLVRTETPFVQVFGEEGRAWEQRNTILKPKQYFQLYVTKLAASNETSPGSTLQPYVSMVGYRTMDLVAYNNAVLASPGAA